MKTRSRYKANRLKLYINVPDKESEDKAKTEIKKFLRRMRMYSGEEIEYEYSINPKNQ